jgi:hypothetical protein
MQLRILLLAILFWPVFSQAQVASHWKHQLWTKWLPALEIGTAEERWQARLAFLTWPEASLSVLRQGMMTSKRPENWRIAQILAQIGDESDIRRMLDAWQSLSGTRQDVWVGSLERLYMRFREESSQKLLLTRLQFESTEAIDPRSGRTDGEIIYKLSNSTASPRLIQVRINIWRGMADPDWPEQLHWLEAGNSVEVSLPVTLLFEPRVPTVRLDLNVMEIGVRETLLHERYEIPVSGRPSPPKSMQRSLTLPKTDVNLILKRQSEEAESG